MANLQFDRRSFILCAAASSVAESAPPRPAEIVLVGYNDMEEMLTALNAGFTRLNPGVTVKMRLPGTRFAPDALASGQSTLAPMGAQFTPPQRSRFMDLTGSEPAGFRIAHASLNPKALSGPNGIFVHSDNPQLAIDLARVRVLFTQPGPHFWGELGMSGPLHDQAVRITGLMPRTPLALEFAESAFPDAVFSSDYQGFGQSRDVIAFIEREPAALGFAAVNRGTDKVRSLAIRRTALSPPITATPATLRSGLYPLDRHLWIYARKQRDGAVNPLARAYLTYVLSKEGQALIAAGSLGYLPLGEVERRTEIMKLSH